MSEKYDDLLSHVQQEDKAIKTLRKRGEQIKQAKVSQWLQQLKHDVAELEQRSLRLSLEIDGMSKSVNENLLSMVNTVAAKLSVAELTELDAEALDRLPSKARMISDMVRFSSHEALLMDVVPDEGPHHKHN